MSRLISTFLFSPLLFLLVLVILINVVVIIVIVIAIVIITPVLPGMPLHTADGQWFTYGVKLPQNLAEIDSYLYNRYG